MEISTNEKLKVVSNMRKYGGSFVQSLGEALIHADSINTAKIKKAFPEYWKLYLEFDDLRNKNNANPSFS